MSVLHSSKVLERIRAGTMYIAPIFSREQIGEISIDLRLGTVALFVKASGLSHIDPSAYMRAESEQYRSEQTKRQKFERHEFPFGNSLLLHPGSLTLVPTLEWLKLPRDLKGVVTARSSWAREGLNIATANFINPGYNGIVTLELANFGQIPIALYPGMRVAQIAFYEVSGNEKQELRGKSQFDMSFEPRAGEITKYDERFIPSISQHAK